MDARRTMVTFWSVLFVGLFIVLVVIAVRVAGGGSNGNAGAVGLLSGGVRPTPQATQPAGTAKKEYSEIVLDLSGSMNEGADGGTKLEIAKQILGKLLIETDVKGEIGMRVYAGQNASHAQSCQDTRLMVPIGPQGNAKVAAAVANLSAAGDTPIAHSLEQAAKDFTNEPSRANSILLISDGAETCGGDPAAVLEQLSKQGFDLRVHVVGFFVDPTAEAFLRSVADSASGTYYPVNSAADFKNVLCQIYCQGSDPDNDGVRAPDDKCPADAEDKDGFEDADGCPESGGLDDDGDGIPVPTDLCPNEKEDVNGYQDGDGCIDRGDPDSDRDGIPVPTDRCPNEKEDLNGYQDGDGCIDGGDPDSDRDGIPVPADQCPNQPENFNGYQDSDGCIDDDDPDHDGIRGNNDQCPNEPENFNGYQDSDGCPENDDPDGDGIRGTKDQCPTTPENFNGYQDSDGCPENDDPDGDGIRGNNDQCPNTPENFNGYQDSDGCPDDDDPDHDGFRGNNDQCPYEPETPNGYQDTDGCPDTKPVTYSFTAWLEEGSTYFPGDQITFCYHLSPENIPFTLNFARRLPGEPGFTPRYAWSDNGIGGGDCLTFTLSPETGTRQYQLTAVVNGQVVGSAILTVIVGGPPVYTEGVF